jgi:hypothetical protein
MYASHLIFFIVQQFIIQIYMTPHLKEAVEYSSVRIPIQVAGAYTGSSTDTPDTHSLI